MSKEETLKIIYIVVSVYPQHYKGFSDLNSHRMLEAWNAVLSDYDYQTVSAGLKAYMSNDKNGFPPSPGQIIDQIHKLTQNTEEKLTEAEAWGLVNRAISNGIYGAEEEFDKLPELVQKAVGSPHVIRTWAQEDMDSMSVIQSNFERAYRTVKERHIEEKKLPNSVKALIDTMSDKMMITG